MKYMPALSEAMCQQVSALLYQLTRPANANDSTLYLFGWQQDVHGNWYMHWDDDMVLLPVHADRSAETLEALAVYVAAGLVSEQSATALAALVAARAGSTVTLGEITPTEWLAVMVDEIEVVEQVNPLL